MMKAIFDPSHMLFSNNGPTLAGTSCLLLPYGHLLPAQCSLDLGPPRVLSLLLRPDHNRLRSGLSGHRIPDASTFLSMSVEWNLFIAPFVLERACVRENLVVLCLLFCVPRDFEPDQTFFEPLSQVT